MTYTVTFNIGGTNGDLKDSTNCRLSTIKRGMRALEDLTEALDDDCLSGVSVRVDRGQWQGQPEETAVVSVMIEVSGYPEVLRKFADLHADRFCHRFSQEAVAWVVSSDNPLTPDHGQLTWHDEIEEYQQLDFDFAYFKR